MSLGCSILSGEDRMLIKIEDGFYLNSQHIIAIRVVKGAAYNQFDMIIEYTPHASSQIASFKKTFEGALAAEQFLQMLNQKIQ